MSKPYKVLLEEALDSVAGMQPRPRLLLQACCGPCSAPVLERLGEVFRVTVLYYNPNTYPEGEFLRRLEALETVLGACRERPELVVPEYDHGDFLRAVKGLEQEPEGGRRCLVCFRLRLEETARMAAREGYDWFGTTLTVGPTKKADVINPIGEALGAQYGVRWLPADFKKGGGYQRSLELSRGLGLYRQNYCGCEFAMGHRPSEGEA